jgi:hypothetical protein
VAKVDTFKRQVDFQLARTMAPARSERHPAADRQRRGGGKWQRGSGRFNRPQGGRGPSRDTRKR